MSSSATTLFVGALVSGTMCTMTSKIMMSLKAPGLTGIEENFEFPLFQTFGMFFGMTLGLILHFIIIYTKIPFPGYEVSESTTKIPIWMYFLLIIPSIFDLVATGLCMMGLMYVNVSVYQILRGSAIIFVALLKQYVLGYKLYKFQWIGVILNVLAILCVGLTVLFDAYDSKSTTATITTTTPTLTSLSSLSTILSSSSMTSSYLNSIKILSYFHSAPYIQLPLDFSPVHVDNNIDANRVLLSSSTPSSCTTTSSDHAIFGVILILLGALVQSLQYAFEEKVMTMDISAPPMLLIGMEGLWGTLICICILYPLAYSLPGKDHGSIENPYNTITMISNSSEIQVIFIVYFFSVLLYNVLGCLVTYQLNSIWHAILDNFRPISVWLVDLSIFYLITPLFGESWTKYSWIQLLGLMILLYGTAIYNSTLKLTGGWLSLYCIDCSEEYKQQDDEYSYLLVKHDVIQYQPLSYDSDDDNTLRNTVKSKIKKNTVIAKKGSQSQSPSDPILIHKNTKLIHASYSTHTDTRIPSRTNTAGIPISSTQYDSHTPTIQHIVSPHFNSIRPFLSPKLGFSPSPNYYHKSLEERMIKLQEINKTYAKKNQEAKNRSNKSTSSHGSGKNSNTSSNASLYYQQSIEQDEDGGGGDLGGRDRSSRYRTMSEV